MAVTIPANDRKASNLYFLGSIFGLTALLLDSWPLFEASGEAMFMGIITLVLGAALHIGIGLGIRKSYWLSKAAFLLLFAYTLVSYLKGFPFSRFTARALIGVLATLIDTGVAAIIIRDLLRRKVAEEAV